MALYSMRGALRCRTEEKEKKEKRLDEREKMCKWKRKWKGTDISKREECFTVRFNDNNK